MQQLAELIYSNQSFLVKRVLEYAKQNGYTKYTSTLEEAWVASISGLSYAMVTGLQRNPEVPEIQVNYDFLHSPVASFGIIEAKKHRSRGISLEMFLSLMKYYRQTYLDLVTESVPENTERYSYLLWILRFFDITEIAFCTEWNSHSNEEVLAELQQTNRDLTNEKNKYLTIYESMPTPALILDANHRCVNINFSAQQLLRPDKHAPGYAYYSNGNEDTPLGEDLPWLKEICQEFVSGDSMEKSIEVTVDSPGMGRRDLLVKLCKMLDVSDKFAGTVILLNDMTEHKRIEKQLREQGIRDQLTGLYNRMYMEEELRRLASGRFNPVAFISIDVDGLKLINDNFGHAAGDALLMTVSQMIRKAFRQNDVVVRYGGDEFIVILPLCDEATIKKSCHRLRAGIDRHQLHYPISVSIGWVIVDMNEMGDPYAPIREADNRMYKEKKTNHPHYEALFQKAVYEMRKY